MCGIAGIFTEGSHSPEKSLLSSMAAALKHRGPDETSVFVDGNMGFGFSRLSIIDPLNGHQPFFGLDGQIALICNGEIFNYKELREELKQKGHRFKTDCDVEVIVSLYIEYGTFFLNKLNGQFAIALFDKRNKSLFLARDHFGICPLFYSNAGGDFVFGSEVKAILRHPLIKRAVNLRGLDQVFTFPGLVSPVTMFENICSVPAGSYMIVRNGENKITQYWDLIYPEERGRVDDKTERFYADTLEEKLLKSVKYRLNADVPVGFYLSGGLDSSLIAAMVKKIRPGEEHMSFSMTFPGNKEMNEKSYQQQVIDHLKIGNTAVNFDSSEIISRLKGAVWSSESALKETYNTCSLALSQAVSDQGLKVILSGEGADEFLGGYVGYRLDKFRTDNGSQAFEQLLEADLRKSLWGAENFFYEKDYFDFTDLKKNVYSPTAKAAFPEFDAIRGLSFDKSKIAGRDDFQKRSYIDLKLRLSDHLVSDHCDRMNYANSVEGRFPFLDVELVDFIRTIPSEIKLKGLAEKYILKKVAEKYLPENVVNRQKFGFVAPGSPALMRANIEWINDLLSFERIKRQGYFDPHVIEFLKKQYSKEGFKLNLPFDSDFLIVVITFNIFLELFDMPDLN